MDIFDELDPPARLLLGPGPSPVHPRVMRALGAICGAALLAMAVQTVAALFAGA